MVTKICKVCGKEFDAKGRALCCSSECSKINKRNSQKNYAQSEKGKVAQKRANKKQRQSDKYKEYQKEYRQSDEYKKYQNEYYKNNRDKILEQQKEYRKSEKGKVTLEKYKQSDRGRAANKKYQKSDKGKATNKRYRQSDRGKTAYNKANLKSRRKKIAELNEKFDGDLESILNKCPDKWHEREAIMQVEYGVSYAESMYKKIQANPVCEVTGESNDLVIHHLDSFNIHPEKGAALDNLVRITREIHDEFHSIYGYGSNTREQWFEFLEKKHNLYI